MNARLLVKINLITRDIGPTNGEYFKMIDDLGKEEQEALLKMIDMALANKRLKDNLQNLLAD